jgi:cysteinyl-tRNA synthetase
VLEIFDTVFDVLKSSAAAAVNAGLTDSEIEALIEERNQAKKAKNFKRSDEIRNLLLEKGILLEDTKDGVRWKRK